MDEQQKQEYEQFLQTGTYEGVRAMNKTIFEEGVEKGRREDRLEVVESLLVTNATDHSFLADLNGHNLFCNFSACFFPWGTE